MSREERKLYDLGGEALPEEEVSDGEGAEDEEDLESHLGYHNFYGY